MQSVRTPSATRPERALHLPLRVSLGEVAPLVDPLLAPRDRDLDLHAAVLEVELGGHERQALLAHLPVERVDLPPVEQELPVTLGTVVRDVSLRVLGDRRADEPGLALADLRVGLP